MRPMVTGAEPGWGNLTRKQSWEPAVEDLWNAWEIQSLILVSLFLQVFLFLFADIRKSCASSIPRKVLWLAYLSADSVAVFVLGHLAAHTRSEPHEQRLMSFWAPFVLVHLGGQETMTAFSMQDNELWKRHLLNLVIQAVVAGYVVGKASWGDRRLKVAMVLIFISGFLNYAGRTLYLYYARPKYLTSTTAWRLYGQGRTSYEDKMKGSKEDMKETLDRMLRGSSDRPRFMESFGLTTDIMAGDAPLNMARSITLEGTGELPGMLMEFQSHQDHYNAYEHVGALLEQCYSRLYTRGYVRGVFADDLGSLFKGKVHFRFWIFIRPQVFIYYLIVLAPILFSYVATPIALALFAAAEKGESLLDSSSSRVRADIMVSYILLVGAIVLEVLSIASFIFSRFRGSKRTYCRQLQQYNMIKNAPGWYIREKFGQDVKTTAITIFTKKFVLDKLLDSGTRGEWHIASTRGQLALLRHNKTTLTALQESVKSSINFPRSVLIWHIATDICFRYSGDKDATSTSYSNKQIMSTQLSNYIMYLVFKCRVMLTTYSNVVHDETRVKIKRILIPSMMSQENKAEHEEFNEKDEVLKIIKHEGKSKEEQGENEITNFEHGESSANNDDPAKIHMKKLHQSAESIYSSSHVCPQAHELAQELISITDEAKRWDLIADVWAEMLYYTAPRCGAAFHAEHLATGGEFVTHVFVLMYLLGPFMPVPSE